MNCNLTDSEINDIAYFLKNAVLVTKCEDCCYCNRENRNGKTVLRCSKLRNNKNETLLVEPNCYCFCGEDTDLPF